MRAAFPPNATPEDRFSHDSLPPESLLHRALAILPLLFFGHVGHTYASGGIPQILWVCNLSCLVMAIGIVARQPLLIWTAALWQLVGTPIWVADGLMTWNWQPHAWGVHFGCPLVGLVALRAMDAPTRRLPWAIGYFVLLQGLCRLSTPPELNVNAAHTVVPWMQSLTPNYPLFWTFNLVLLLGILAAFDAVLTRVHGWRRVAA